MSGGPTSGCLEGWGSINSSVGRSSSSQEGWVCCSAIEHQKSQKKEKKTQKKNLIAVWSFVRGKVPDENTTEPILTRNNVAGRSMLATAAAARTWLWAVSSRYALHLGLELQKQRKTCAMYLTNHVILREPDQRFLRKECNTSPSSSCDIKLSLSAGLLAHSCINAGQSTSRPRHTTSHAYTHPSISGFGCIASLFVTVRVSFSSACSLLLSNSTYMLITLKK